MQQVDQDKKIVFSAQVEEALSEQLQKYGIAFGDHDQFRDYVDKNVLLHNSAKGTIDFYIASTKKHILRVWPMAFKFEKK